MGGVQAIFAAFLTGSLALLLVSLVKKDALAAYCAALVAVPICVYLAMYPIAFFIPLIFPLLLVYGGRNVARKRQVALLCYLPYMGISTLILIFGFVLDAW
jgi:hypothetical protein